MNPLTTLEPFVMELMNPNPSFRMGKDGPVRRISFEVTEDDWQLFVNANLKGMILAAQMCVEHAHEELPVKPKGGPISKNAGMFCDEFGADRFAVERGHEDMRRMIYSRCGIQSRAELDHNETAQKAYEFLRAEFHAEQYKP
jgi:hypothetical protein